MKSLAATNWDKAIKALNRRMGGGTVTPVIIGEADDGLHAIEKHFFDINASLSKNAADLTMKAINIHVDRSTLSPSFCSIKLPEMKMVSVGVAGTITSAFGASVHGCRSNFYINDGANLDMEGLNNECKKMYEIMKEYSTKIVIINNTEWIWDESDTTPLQSAESMDSICTFFDKLGIRTAFSGSEGVYRGMKIASINGWKNFEKYEMTVIPRMTNNGAWRQVARNEIMETGINFRLTEKRADRLFHMTNGSVKRLQDIIRSIGVYSGSLSRKGNHLNILDVLDTQKNI